MNSERSFGIVMCCFFLILFFLKDKSAYLVISGGFGFLAVVFPTTLKIPNLLWNKLGELLHQITSPLILFILFFGVFSFFGIVFRLFGKRMLAVDHSQTSFWKKSETTSFKDQF